MLLCPANSKAPFKMVKLSSYSVSLVKPACRYNLMEPTSFSQLPWFENTPATFGVTARAWEEVEEPVRP